MSGATQAADRAAGVSAAGKRSIRDGALDVSLTRDAYSYNDEQFTLELSRMDGEHCVETDAELSGLAISASQAEIDVYLEAALRRAKQRAGDEIAVRNVSGYAAAAGMTAVRQAKNAPAVAFGGPESAAIFFSELLGCCESLQAMAEEFGTRTFADLMYLQHAILSGTSIDVWPGETRVGEVLGKLPSSERWISYTKLGGVWAGACEQIAVQSVSTNQGDTHSCQTIS